VVDSSWNVKAHGDAREGKWRGNWRMEWVASTLHTTSEHGVSSITTADAHTSAASSRLNWRPRRFKLTRPFYRKTKSGFCACAVTFKLASNFESVRDGCGVLILWIISGQLVMKYNCKFLNLGTWLRWVSRLKAQLLYSRGDIPLNLLCKKLVGPRVGMGVLEERKSVDPAGIRTSIIQSVADSLYCICKQ